MRNLISYFDLTSNRRVSEVKGRRNKSPSHWVPQYISLILGILIQPFFAAYQQTGNWNFAGFSGRILFALIVGLAIFPAVYKSAFDPDKPLFVQLCAIFAAGMGWESLLKTALKVSGI